MKGWVLPAVALAGALGGAAAMWGIDARSGGAVGPQVRAYLLAHPEVIPEAMAKLQDRESGKLIAARRAEIERPYAGAWAGSARPDVTAVEYFDYNCGYCRASVPVVGNLLARDPHLRVVYRDLPILAQSSHAAARASLAAAAQGKFVAFHDSLYALGQVSDASIAKAAGIAEIDPARVPADADAEIRRNVEMAQALGMSGTPTWVIGNRLLQGAQSLDALEEAVAAARGDGGTATR